MIKLDKKIVITLIIVNFISVGIYGRNYGSHWDEYYLFQGINNFIDQLILIPKEYTYNSIYFYLGSIPLLFDFIISAPKIFIEVFSNPTRPLDLNIYPSILNLQISLKNRINSENYIFIIRTIYILITSLSLIWIFNIGKEIYKDYKVGIFSAIYIGMSWEVQYHSRWIAVDTIFMQFFSLQLLLLLKYINANTEDSVKRLKYLVLSAISAGFGIGCKLPAVFMFLPLMVAIYLNNEKLKTYLLAFIVLLLAFISTTPGAILDPIRFFGAIIFEYYGYNLKHSVGYDHYVGNLFEHLTKAYIWIALEVPSNYIVISALITVVCIYGFYQLNRFNKKYSIILLSFVIPYSIFISINHLFIIRNWLVIIPIFSIYFGVGIYNLILFIKSRKIKHGKLFLFIFLFLYVSLNFFSEWYYARGIKKRSLSDNNLSLINYINDKKLSNFYISEKIYSKITDSLNKNYLCSASSGLVEDTPTFINALEWHAGYGIGLPNTIKRIFGTNEANYSYYPTWVGNDRQTRVYMLNYLQIFNSNIVKSNFYNCQKN